MSADISAISNLSQSAEPLDMEMYPDAREAAPLPKKGEYVLKAPDSFPSTAFGATQAGALSASVDSEIVGPTNEGYTIKYQKVSAKVFKRGGLPASQLGDYLRACGIKGKISADPQAQADAVEQTAGKIYKAICDWRAYHSATKFAVEGMEKFPKDGNGGHLPFINHPTEKDAETGEPVRLRAQLMVSRYLPASN